MYLAGDDHRIDHPADIVNRSEPDHVDIAGFRVDFDFADMRARPGS